MSGLAQDGSTSTLFSLPRELRNLIYMEVMTHRTAIAEKHDFNDFQYNVGTWSMDTWTDKNLPDRHQKTRLVLVCKQIRAEALECLRRPRQRPAVVRINAICERMQVWPRWIEFPLYLHLDRPATAEITIRFLDNMLPRRYDVVQLAFELLSVPWLYVRYPLLDSQLRPKSSLLPRWTDINIEMLNEDLYTSEDTAHHITLQANETRDLRPSIDCKSVTINGSLVYQGPCTAFNERSSTQQTLVPG